MRRPFLRAALFVATAALLTGCFGGGKPEAELDRACLADLDRHAIDYAIVSLSPAADERCGVATPLRVDRLEARLTRPATMSCTMARSFDRFEREAIEPLAERELGRQVTGIDHFGAYSCRDNTSQHGSLSEHGRGRAFDVSGFRFSDGSSASVLRDWSRPGPERDFLHDVARNACRYFSVVLTPDSNRDHYNHFHFDIGPGRVCSVGM